MKKKTIVASVLLGVLLIGIVTAGLVPYLSNMVSGEVTVEGPVFYLDGSSIPLSENPEVIYRGITINTPPTEENITYLFDGQRYLFMSEPLGVDYFYPANFEVIIWSKTNNSGNILQFNIVKVKQDLSEELICSAGTIEPNSGPSFTKRTTNCNSDGEISLNPEDRIGLIITGAGIDSEYWISTGENYTDGYSRIEVTAI